VLAVWPEQEELVVAIVCEGKLSWAQSIHSLDADIVTGELPGLLITAELEGVNTNFTSIRLSPDCSHLEPTLVGQFTQPIQPLTDLNEATGPIDLLPSSWQDEANRRAKGEKVKQKLLVAAVVYLLLVAGAFGYLAWMKTRARKLLTEYAQLEPKHRDIQRQQDRWAALSPTLEPPRFGVEVLHQLVKAWGGSEALQFTSFTYTPREWILKGEGTTDSHFDFSQRLKNSTPELSESFTITYPNPTNIKDERVSFTITGKPR
jgi:hypothetical protein